jgi:hypothetical protein
MARLACASAVGSPKAFFLWQLVGPAYWTHYEPFVDVCIKAARQGLSDPISVPKERLGVNQYKALAGLAV